MDDLKGIPRHYLGADLARLDLTPAAVQARGMAGAHGEAAVRRAARRAGRTPTADDLRAVLAEGMPPLGERVRLRAAVHEAGHALVVASATGRPVVLPVHAAGGLTELGDIDKVGATTVAELEDLLVMMLVGRAAEEAILGDVSAGPSATSGPPPAAPA